MFSNFHRIASVPIFLPRRQVHHIRFGPGKRTMELPFLVLLLGVCFFHWTTAASSELHVEIDNGVLMKVTRLNDMKAIALTNRNITSIAKDAFNELTDIKSLDLSHNAIKKLEDFTFKSLENLEELSLAHNKLQSLDFDQSTSIFAGLRHLQRLNLSGNDVSRISSYSFVGLPNDAEVIIDQSPPISEPLYFLFGGHYRVGTEPNALVKLCKTNDTVKSLSMLKVNEKLDENCSKIPTFSSFAYKVSLRDCGLRKFNRNWYQLHHTGVIDLSHNLINDITPELLNDLPMADPPLTVDLRDNNISIIKKNIIKNENCMTLLFAGKSLQVIEDDAFKDLCLTSLIVEGTSVSNSNFIRTLPDTIRILEVYNNDISEIPSDSFHNLRQLTSIDLSSNKIKTIGENTFSGLRNDVWINLTHNQINFIDASSFFHAKIIFLDLTNNEITNESIREGAFRGSIIKYIDLSMNNMKSFDEESFFGILGECTIRYDSNPITRIMKNLNYRNKTI